LDSPEPEIGLTKNSPLSIHPSWGNYSDLFLIDPFTHSWWKCS
jgi:hypothetical protein